MLWRAEVDRLPEDRTGRKGELNSETVREQATRRRSRPSIRAPYGVGIGVTVGVGVTLGVGVGLTTTTVVEVPDPSLGNFLKVMKSVAPRTGATVT